MVDTELAVVGHLAELAPELGVVHTEVGVVEVELAAAGLKTYELPREIAIAVPVVLLALLGEEATLVALFLAPLAGREHFLGVDALVLKHSVYRVSEATEGFLVIVVAIAGVVVPRPLGCALVEDAAPHAVRHK